MMNAGRRTCRTARAREKAAVGTRMKRPGSHWSIVGANAVPVLGICMMNSRLTDFIDWRSRQTLPAQRCIRRSPTPMRLASTGDAPDGDPCRAAATVRRSCGVQIAPGCWVAARTSLLGPLPDFRGPAFPCVRGLI